MERRPVLCAECHASNALAAPGVADLPNLSQAMHEGHAEEEEDEGVTSTLAGCYQCHPGPQTQCLRDVMSLEHGMDCIDCHGTMTEVAANAEPWLNEPRCDNVACHGPDYAQDQPLYGLATEHGGIYCAGCHDSPHAIAPSREANEWLKFTALGEGKGPIRSCNVCHTTAPEESGPHGISAPVALDHALFLPALRR